MGIYLRNKIYYIDYYAGNDRIREPAGTSRRDAERLHAKRLAELSAGSYIHKRDAKVTFRQFAKTYFINHSKANKKSWKTDEFRIETLNDCFGNQLLTQIRPLDIERFKAERLEKMAKATVNRELALLKNIFTKATHWGTFNRLNPVKMVQMCKEDNERLRFLTKEEIAKLLEHCDGELLALVKFALNTGMRRGEIMNLTWNDIDIERGLIYIRDSKSGKARILPMNDTVKEVLLGIQRVKGVKAIFRGVHRDKFDRVLEKTGITDASFHTLRHTVASHLAMAGVDLHTISRILGHSDAKMTLRYAHLSPDFMANAMQRLVTNRSQNHVFDDEMSDAFLSETYNLQ